MHGRMLRVMRGIGSKLLSNSPERESGNNLTRNGCRPPDTRLEIGAPSVMPKSYIVSQ